MRSVVFFLGGGVLELGCVSFRRDSLLKAAERFGWISTEHRQQQHLGCRITPPIRLPETPLESVVYIARQNPHYIFPLIPRERGMASDSGSRINRCGISRSMP